MKIKFLTGLFFFIFLFSCNKTELHIPNEELMKNHAETFRVMTFNIRFDNPDDGENAWPNRKEFAAGMIRFHAADIVGVQEALAHQLTDLDGLLPEFSWLGVGRNADGGGEYSAVLYREGRFTVVEKGTFWLSDLPDTPGSTGWDAALPRIATHVRFRDQITGKQFFLVNTHFDHVGVVARQNSARLILEKIAELAGGDPVILMGDLNTTERDEPYKELAENEFASGRILLDGFYHSEEPHHGPATTWNGFRQIIPDRRIDFIFASDDVVQQRHGILSDTIDGKFPSDHLPVVSDIILP